MRYSPFPVNSLSKFAAINGVSASNKGDVSAVLYARAELVRLVLADARTREMFGSLRSRAKLDVAVSVFSSMLDQEAKRLGEKHRSVFRGERFAISQSLYSGLTRDGQIFFSDCCQILETRISRSRESRASAVWDFVSLVLYRGDSSAAARVAPWLSYALMEAFEAELQRDAWGVEAVRVSLSAGAFGAGAVQKGRKPKANGEHLERYVGWYYRLLVANPPSTLEVLAGDYSSHDGRDRAPRDEKGANGPRPDTKSVRVGVSRARYLLEELAFQPQK